jgi:hypothetical protein
LLTTVTGKSASAIFGSGTGIGNTGVSTGAWVAIAALSGNTVSFFLVSVAFDDLSFGALLDASASAFRNTGSLAAGTGIASFELSTELPG